jgi:serine/threonine protein kinase/tetratricopeptide (TPR) repeat protein
MYHRVFNSTMNPHPNREVALFSAALELDSKKRAAFLDEACADDPVLRLRLEALLRVHEEAIPFLENQAPTGQEPPVGAEFSGKPGNLSSSRAEKAGDRIGRYKLLQQVGEGGCGIVYMAEQEEPVRRRVALKVIKLGMDTKQVIARFEAERQALALMDHPNIAKVLDAGATETGRPYFVMELVHGIKITEYCDQNNFSTEDRLKLFIQVCQAIQHAHQKGIIHRDIKPSNILVTVNDPGASGCPKVIDFGIAKATTGQRLTDKTVFTAFEQFIGTPAYMSPEQAIMTSLDIDTRTDIYALGVLLYELLTSQTPFDAKDLAAAGLDAMRRILREQEPAKPSTRLTQELLAAEMRRRQLKREIQSPKSENEFASSTRRLQQLIHVLRGDLDWIVMKCLEKDRTRRYETASGLAGDIQRHLDNEPVVARPPSRIYRLQKMLHRNKLVFAAAAIISTLLVVGVVISTSQAIRATRAERDQSRLREQADIARNEEGRERAKAQANEKKAAAEAAKSQQVSRFLQDMLQGVGPSVTLGRDATMLREILDKTAARLGNELTNQPEVEFALRATLANTYHELGLYHQMEEMARKGLQIVRAQPGEEDEAIAVMLTSLGDALMHLGDLDGSEKCTLEALALQRKLLSSEQLDNEHKAAAVLSLHLLADVLGTRGRSAEAESLEWEALGLARNLLGNEHPNLAMPLGNLGSALLSEGKLPEAEIMLREAMAIERKLSGAEHPDLAISLDVLAQVLRKQGKLEEAETMFCEGLVMRRKLLGNEHPGVATSLNNLATVLSEQHKLPEAEAMYREALALRRRLFGNDYPGLATTLRNLGILLHDQNKLLEAEGMYREALALQRKQLGNEHLEVTATLDKMAAVLSDEGKLVEAEAAFREQLILRRKLLGKEHPEVVDSLVNLAFVLSAEENLAEAETTLREALAVVRQISLKDQSREIALFGVVLHHLAEVLQQRKVPAEARTLAEEAAAMYQRHPDWPSDERRHALEVLADILTDLGDFAELEVLYRRELALIRKLSANEPMHEISDLGLILHHLAMVLQQRKALAEARAVAEEAAVMYQRHPDWPSDERDHAFAVLQNVLTDLGDFGGIEVLRCEQLEALRRRLATDDPELASVIVELASALLEEKKFTEAEPLARECLAIREKKLPDDWRTFNARSMLGATLLGQKKYAEAEAFLLSGYEGVKQRENRIPAVGRPRLKEALQRLVQLYEAKDRPDQAADWKQKLELFNRQEAEKKASTAPKDIIK